MQQPQEPLGARGPHSGRDFDPEKSGGPIRKLSTDKVRITERGIAVVEQHLQRFGPDGMNQGMIERLRLIAAGKIKPTQADLNFYTHELREYVRYRKLGFKEGQPANDADAHELWNNAHTATLEDYGLREGAGVLYHPEVEAAHREDSSGRGPAGGRDRSERKKGQNAQPEPEKEGVRQSEGSQSAREESTQERIDRITGVKKGEAHDSEMAGLREQLEDQDAFIKKYTERFPDSTLSPQELAERARRGGELNEETGRIQYPNQKEAIDYRHKYQGQEQTVTPQDKARLAKLKKLLRERDKAIHERDKYPEGSDKYKEHQQQVVEASRDIGELAAQEYMAQRHPEYVQEKLGTGSQRDVFDQVYTYTDPETGVEKFIIVEAKGGKSPLGSRRVHGGGKRAEQGTREYFDEIVAKMTSSENPDIRRVGEKLTLVENPEEVVKYLHVETAIEKGSTGDGGGPGSSIKQISGREFDLHPDVHNDKQGTQ